MMQPGRLYSSGSGYRYGFNGKENDNEVKGEGNQQDYGERIYDPRLGKFLSVDPLTASYPWYTPYQFAGNKPIAFVDIDGMEEGSLEINTRRREEAYLSGKITASQYSAQTRASGAWGTLAGIAVADAFLTKGRITQFLYASIILGHLHHNGTNDPVEQKKRADDLTNDLIGGGTGLVLGKVLKGASVLFKGAKDILKTSYTYGEATVATQVGKEMVQIGKGGIGPGGYLELEINVKVGANGTKVAHGEVVFDELYKTVKADAATSINGIRGVWTYGDNLKNFNQLITDKVNKGLMTVEEAAMETFTGRMAKKSGFDKVQSISGEKNSDGTYKAVTEIIFGKK